MYSAPPCSYHKWEAHLFASLYEVVKEQKQRIHGCRKVEKPPCRWKRTKRGTCFTRAMVICLSGRAVCESPHSFLPIWQHVQQLVLSIRPWFKRSHFLELDSACLTAFRTKQNFKSLWERVINEPDCPGSIIASLHFPVSTRCSAAISQYQLRVCHTRSWSSRGLPKD